MTFVAYARSRRMGIAMDQIRRGEKIINAQLDCGYESSSGFRDAFAKILGVVPTKSVQLKLLKSSWIDTILGSMIAIADEESLYLLEFVDRRGLEREVERLRIKAKAAIIPGKSPPLISIEKELKQYFSGKLKNFTTPIYTLGSPFQQQVWQELQKIPAGETRSYLDIAKAIKKPTGSRAVAQSNGANQLAIIIPCHRVINHNGNIGGYGGGIHRKEWMLQHEKK